MEWKLTVKADVALNTAGVEKNTLGKLAIAVNLESIRFEFWTERSVSDDGYLCPLWSVILKSVWDSVGDTFQLRCSWPWAVLCSLLCPETDWNIRVEKQGYVFILNNFKKWCFDACITDNNQCVNNYLRLRKVEFIRWINLINVIFIGFVKLEINEWFSAYQDNFVFGLVSLDCGLLANFLRKKWLYLSFSC